MVGGRQRKLGVRGCWQSCFTFEEMIEPQRHRDGDLGREAVVEMRGPRVLRGLRGDERVRAIHVIHPAVEIVRRAAMQHGAFDQRRVALEAQRATEDFDIAFDVLLLRRAAEELVRLPAPADF